MILLPSRFRIIPCDRPHGVLSRKEIGGLAVGRVGSNDSSIMTPWNCGLTPTSTHQPTGRFYRHLFLSSGFCGV